MPLFFSMIADGSIAKLCYRSSLLDCSMYIFDDLIVVALSLIQGISHCALIESEHN